MLYLLASIYILSVNSEKKKLFKKWKNESVKENFKARNSDELGAFSVTVLFYITLW